MNFYLSLLLSIPAILCMSHSLKKQFSPQSVLWKQVVLFLLLYVTFSLPSWIGDENPVFLFPVFMAVFWICFKGDKLKRLAEGGIFYTLLVSFNMIIDSLYRFRQLPFAAMLVKLGAWCLFGIFLSRLTPEGGIRLSKRLWTLLLCLTLAPLSAILSFSLWGYHAILPSQIEPSYDMMLRLGLSILPFGLISALALLFAAGVLSRHETLEYEHKLGALREVYYAGLKQEQTQLRTLRHDLRNHVSVLQGLLEQGNQSELADYLTQLCASPALNGCKCYTENEAANVVLSSKAAQMEALGLLPDFEIMLPEALSIPAPELCALLGNALDNAIEGAKHASSHVITLRARAEKGIFMLQVQNTIGHEINPDYATTKPNASKHGYGLAGMREIAARHGGFLETTVKAGQFELLICFPCTPDFIL